MKLLSAQEINHRLHKFNNDGDWSNFNDIPFEQQINVLYPHVITRNPKISLDQNTVQRKQILNNLFGPL